MAASALRPCFAQRKLTLLIVFSVYSVVYAQKPPMVDVGVVLPQDVITGETVSGSIIVNPNDYAAIPGLHVVKGQVPGVAGSAPANLLGNYSLRIGVSATTLPADHPFSFIVSNELLVTMFRTGGKADEGWSTTIPLSPTIGQNFPTPKNFSLPPLNWSAVRESSSLPVDLDYGTFRAGARVQVDFHSVLRRRLLRIRQRCRPAAPDFQASPRCASASY
jgi:hypothetical protein